MSCTFLTRDCAEGEFTAILQGERGPLVVLMHGFPDLPGSFDSLVPPLLSAGYRVLRLVMRGYELGSVQQNRDYHALRLADDVIVWLDYLNESSASIVGHDWGAVAGWAAIGRASHRFRAFVALAIPHTGAFMKSIPRHPRQWLNSRYMMYFQWPHLAERALADPQGKLIRRLWSDWSPGWVPPENHLSEVIQRLSHPSIGDAVLGYYRCLFRPWEAPNRELLLMMGHSPRVPVLALAGARDGCVRPEFFEACMNSVAAPGLVGHLVLPNVGHFLHMEDPPAVLGEMLPFLQRWHR